MSALDDYLNMYGRPVSGLAVKAVAELAQIRTERDEMREAIKKALDKLEKPEEVDMWVGSAFRLLAAVLAKYPENTK